MVRRLAKVGAVGFAVAVVVVGIGVANAATTSGRTGSVASASASPSTPPGGSGTEPERDPEHAVTPAGCKITVVTDPGISNGAVTARTQIQCPRAVRTLEVMAINLMNEETGQIVSSNYIVGDNTDHVEATVTHVCHGTKPTKYRTEVLGFSNEDNIAFGYQLGAKSKNCPILACGA